MCYERPCFVSLLGLPLKTIVMDIGITELGFTLIVTTLNVIKYIEMIEWEDEDCNGVEICVGPLIKVVQRKM